MLSTSTDATVVIAPVTSKDVVSVQVSIIDIDKFEKDNKKVCGHLLNDMTDSLFVDVVVAPLHYASIQITSY